MIFLLIIVADNFMNKQQLGIDLAKLLKWDGLGILQVAHAALEDANFHTEALAVREMIEKEKAAIC